MEELIPAIAQVGFPIAVSSYLLIKFQSTIDKQSQQLERIVLLIETLMKRLEK